MAKLRGHKPGCHCVGCDPNTRKRGMAALKRHPRQKKNPKLTKKEKKYFKKYQKSAAKILKKSGYAFTRKYKKLVKKISTNKRKRRNPSFKWTGTKREHEVTIYAKFLPFKIYAVKGSSSMYAGERFQHQFKAGGRVTGLSDGSIRLYPAKGKRLWGMIKQR